MKQGGVLNVTEEEIRAAFSEKEAWVDKTVGEIYNMRDNYKEILKSFKSLSYDVWLLKRQVAALNRRVDDLHAKLDDQVIVL